MRKFFAIAFAGILGGLGMLLAPSSQAAPNLGDCKRVAVADRALCQQVKRQVAYVYFTEGGTAGVAKGSVLVREITHQGLTKREMHSYLTGEALAYAQHVTQANAVAIDLTSLRKHHGSDVQVIVGFTDVDGKPGGKKRNRVELDLP